MSLAEYESYVDLKILKSLRKKFPNHYGILYELGRYYFYTNSRKALHYFFQAKELSAEQDIDVYLIIARLYYHLGKYARAAHYYELAEKLGTFPDQHLHLAAWSFQEIDQYAKAVHFYEQFLKSCPDHVDAWVNTGFCYGHLNLADKALECSLKAVQLSPNHEIALLNTGFHFWIEQDLAKAYSYTDMVLRINPNYDYALMNMGHIYLCKEVPEKALEYYQKSALQFEDVKEFVRLFEDDYKYMVVYGISEDDFFRIRDLLVDFWHKKKH